jgi:hypothetical protein
MKTFLKIVASVLVFFVVILIGLNLYFTDERLKNTVMPYVNNAVGRTVEVESMSLTFFSTFPQPGLSIRNMQIPGETETDTLMALDELVASVQLFSLMGDQIKISEIKLHDPRFTYIVNPDSSTNIDFLLETEETEQDTSAGYAVDIPYFYVTEGNFGYRDSTSHTNVQFSDVNADISLNYADLIKSSINLELGGLSASVNDTTYLNNLPLSLSQESTIDLDNEVITLEEGTVSIRGLALNLYGSISEWSTILSGDLTFRSSSDNFGELLRLVPDEHQKYIEGLETRGTLAIDGTLKGPLAGDDFPAFDISIDVTDGYVKNPELPDPIQNIQLSANASNDLLAVETLTANAGENTLTATGQLTNPMEENGEFSVDMEGDVNLATISRFYDIGQFDIEQMSGQLAVNGQAKGNRSTPDEATFDAIFELSNGTLKYAQVPKPIENISVDANANQSAITINNMQLQAAENTFSMEGTINQPLKEEQRSIDLQTNLDFDLATIKDFYPIDEDTLSMRGKLMANATLKGKADQIENSVQSGKISLNNGYISHKSLGEPIEEITLESTINGPTLSISKASFKTGDNSLSTSGTITDYLSENRALDLKMSGNAALNQITNYYDLEPTITELTGQADLDLQASGPIADPANMEFNGQLTIKDVNMDGEAMVQPVTNLNGELTLSPKSADLTSLSFDIGSSDIALNGSLQNYMTYLQAEEDRSTTPNLEGSYKSKLLDLDELINWDDTTTVEIPIHLPDLNSSVDAEIDKMIATGVTMTNLEAQAGTTPEQIKLNKATVELFDGEASGSFTWDVPQPDHTMISFQGSLDSLQAEAFFSEYPILGQNSKFHEYVSGSFSANVNYYSELNVYLEPLIETSTMDGNFGMTKAKLQGHPLQDRLASLFKADEFQNVALDEWKSTFALSNSIFTIKNLQLTSDDIGLELNGTQHMIKGDINYQMKVLLPGRFKSAISSVITKQATEALTQDNGTIMVPLRVTGTHENPKISPDKEVIAPIVKEYLKDKAGNVLKSIFGGNR